MGDYWLGHTLGEGVIGKVKLATHVKTYKQVAIKFISRKRLQTRRQTENLHREINITMSISHPNIIKVHDIIDTNPHYIGIVMEYVPGGELFQLLERLSVFSEMEAFLLFHQLCGALSYLHKKGIAHRDLKLENIMLDKKHNVRLIDFGLSKYGDAAKKMRTLCGTKYYLAPEIVRGESYSYPCDIWSVGVILFTMCCGFLPFDHGNEVLLMKTISLGLLKMPSFLSPDLQDLIRKILNPSQLQRMKIETIMQHPWIHRIEGDLQNNKGKGGRAPPIRFQIEQALDNNRAFQRDATESAHSITLSTCIKARYNIKTDGRVHSRVQTPTVSMDSKNDSSSSPRMKPGQLTGNAQMSMRSPHSTAPMATSPQSKSAAKTVSKASKMGKFLQMLKKGPKTAHNDASSSSDRSPSPQIAANTNSRTIATTSRSSRAQPVTPSKFNFHPNHSSSSSNSPAVLQATVRQGRRRMSNLKVNHKRDSWSPSQAGRGPQKKKLELVAKNKFQYSGKDRHLLLNSEAPISPLARRRHLKVSDSKKASKVQFEDSARVSPALKINVSRDAEDKLRRITVAGGRASFVRDEKETPVRCESPSVKMMRRLHIGTEKPSPSSNSSSRRQRPLTPSSLR